LEGDVLPGRDGKQGTMLLRANIDHLQLEDVIADAWTQKVRGDLRIDAKLEGDPGKPGEAMQTGTITLDKGILEAFPILETLATFTGSERFRHVALRDGASAHFTRQGKRTIVEGIDLQSDGLAKLTGAIQIEDKALSGNLRLGVIPGSVSWLPGAGTEGILGSRFGLSLDRYCSIRDRGRPKERPGPQIGGCRSGERDRHDQKSLVR